MVPFDVRNFLSIFCPPSLGSSRTRPPQMSMKPARKNLRRKKWRSRPLQRKSAHESQREPPESWSMTTTLPWPTNGRASSPPLLARKGQPFQQLPLLLLLLLSLLPSSQFAQRQWGKLKMWPPFLRLKRRATAPKPTATSKIKPPPAIVTAPTTIIITLTRITPTTTTITPTTITRAPPHATTRWEATKARVVGIGMVWPLTRAAPTATPATVAA